MKKVFGLFFLFSATFSLASCGGNPEPEPVNPSYTVTFNGNGGTLVSGTEVQTVKSPSEIVAPVYEKEDYDFTGWDKDIATITTSTTVYAQWEYYPEDDTNVEIDGFIKQDNKLSSKTDNDITTFSFSNNVHVAKGTTWKLYSDIRGQEEIITKTIDLNVGDNTVYINVTARSGRNELYTIVVRRLDIFTITWIDDDETHLSTTYVQEDSMPEYDKGTPTKPTTEQYTYTFDGWVPSIVKASGDTTYKASYSSAINKYTISWYNGATLLHSEELEYGKMPTYHWTDKPSKEQTQRIRYDWNGWEETITTVTGNAEYHAHFDEVNKYLITYKNYDGTVLQESYVPSDILPTYEGAQPTRPPDAQYTYEPVGWDKDEVKPTCDTVYIYTYQPVVNKYKITWMGGINGDQLLDEKMVAYGDTPTAPDDVPKTITEGVYKYTFLNTWSPVVTKVTGAATYVAQYKQELIEFNITWKNYDGEVLQSGSVPYGTIPSYSGTPTKVINNHSFEWIGWDKEILPATQDETYKAVFDNDITFDFEGICCAINGKTEFTDVYTFDESAEPALINYVIKPIDSYSLPETISVYVDNNLVTSGYSYDKSTGAFSIASNLGNIRLKVIGVQL